MTITLGGIGTQTPPTIIGYIAWCTNYTASPEAEDYAFITIPVGISSTTLPSYLLSYTAAGGWVFTITLPGAGLSSARNDSSGYGIYVYL